MAGPVTPCDSCGSPIPDSDLETGSAITLLGKRYCPGCKTEAIQSVSLDDLASRPAPAAKPAPRPAAAANRTPAKPAPPPPARAAAPPKPAPTKTPPPPPDPTPRSERKSPARRPSTPGAPAKSSSRAPILIAVAAVVVLGGGAAAVLLGRGSPPPTETHGTKTGPGPGPAPADRGAQAKAAYGKVVEVSRRAGTSWDLILAAAEQAKPACRGTEWEKPLEELRARAAQEKETEEAASALSPLIDELKGAVAGDPEFKRFAELQPKFQLALETAGKTASSRMGEIRALREQYNGKYEKLAEPYYASINEEATALAEERRFDDALRRINAFPQHLRQSQSWLTLDKLRQDIERRKKDAAPKK